MSKPNPSMYKKTVPCVVLVLFIIAALVAAWLVYSPSLNTPPTTPAQGLVMKTQISGAPAIGGPFSLRDDKGNAVTEQSLVGDTFHLIFFGFANCPDVCPGMLSLMAGVEGKLPEATRNQLQFVFVSVDPDRDSLEKLGEYVRGFSPNFVGWSGPKAEIDRMVKGYLAYYAIRPAEAGRPAEEYSVDHSGFAYLMGPDGKYIAHFRSSDSALALQKLLEENVR